MQHVYHFNFPCRRRADRLRVCQRRAREQRPLTRKPAALV
jgi:hypothetical protein